MGSKVRLGSRRARCRQSEPLSGFEKLDSAGGYLTWTTEFSEWLDSITEKRPPSCTGHDGRAALEAALTLRESDKKGQPVPSGPACRGSFSPGGRRLG